LFLGKMLSGTLNMEHRADEADAKKVFLSQQIFVSTGA
jgi:hypothetical protein